MNERTVVHLLIHIVIDLKNYFRMCEQTELYERKQT